MKKIFRVILAIIITCTLPISAFAESGEVAVNGHIGLYGPSVDPGGDPTNPGEYDITYHTSVNWWVTQANPGVVVDGDEDGPNSTVINIIQNNNDTQIKVSLEAFNLANEDAQDATMQDALELFLTGDLAEDGVGAINLNVGYDGSTVYTDVLEEDDPWTYGFTGTYDMALSTDTYEPEYTMTLGFTF